MSEIITELGKFLEKLDDYEPGIINIIQYYTKTYTFNSNEELKDVVKLWYENKEEFIKKYGHISDWDTSRVTDMSYLFGDMQSFNEDISRWDTGNVTNMEFMFGGTTSFNQVISSWYTSKVINMSGMFYYARSFNENISSWDTSKVINMSCMFYEANDFNQDISNWETRLAEYGDGLFYNCPVLKEYKPVFN
jgi:surface protein